MIKLRVLQHWPYGPDWPCYRIRVNLPHSSVSTTYIANNRTLNLMLKIAYARGESELINAHNSR